MNSSTLTATSLAEIFYDALQLREHLTGDEILKHGRDWIVLEAILLRSD
jgi:hypothetical protein